MLQNCALFAPIRHLAKTLAVLLAVISPALAAESDASDWSPGVKSAARLVSAGGLSGRVYLAGLEIKLAGSALTYWRNPGDAGVPPVFSFAGSENLAGARVQYPAPQRIDEGGLDAFGYRGEVVFPIELEPANAAKPIELNLDLQYAACEKICVPAQASLRFRFQPKASAGPQARRIAAFAEQVPKPASEPGAPSLRIARQAPQPGWNVALSPSSAVSDLFAEGPDGWYFDTKRDRDGFALLLSQRPAGSRETIVEVVLTYTSPNGAYEVKQRLDVDPANP